MHSAPRTAPERVPTPSAVQCLRAKPPPRPLYSRVSRTMPLQLLDPSFKSTQIFEGAGEIIDDSPDRPRISEKQLRLGILGQMVKNYDANPTRALNIHNLGHSRETRPSTLHFDFPEPESSSIGLAGSLLLSPPGVSGGVPFVLCWKDSGLTFLSGVRRRPGHRLPLHPRGRPTPGSTGTGPGRRAESRHAQGLRHPRRHPVTHRPHRRRPAVLLGDGFLGHDLHQPFAPSRRVSTGRNPQATSQTREHRQMTSRTTAGPPRFPGVALLRTTRSPAYSLAWT